MIKPKKAEPQPTKTIPVIIFKSLGFLICLRIYNKEKIAKPKIVEKITRIKSKIPTKNKPQDDIIHDP